MKTPRGDGVGEEGPESRSWRNTQRKRRVFFFCPARSLGEDAAVLRSEHPFSDWLLEGAQGSGRRHRASRCLHWLRVMSGFPDVYVKVRLVLCVSVLLFFLNQEIKPKMT